MPAAIKPSPLYPSGGGCGNFTDVAGNKRGYESADVYTHVENGKTSVPSGVVRLIKFADYAWDIRFKKAVAHNDEHQTCKQSDSGGYETVWRKGKLAQSH